MPSVFLSHSSKDKFFVRELAERLRAQGVHVWLDEAEINVGDSLTEKIGRAIDETDYFLVVLSNHSVDSEWVQKELQIAMQRELKERDVVVLPVLLEAVALPPFLRDKFYADFSSPEGFEKNFPRLLRSLGVEHKEESRERAARKPTVPPEAVARLTAAERKLAGFEDIRIVDLDDSRSYNPDASKGLYNMYLQLSAQPPAEWGEIFEAERRFPRHTMWRRAWIEGGFIVIYCVPDELEKYHLRDLRQDVASANAKYREYLTELARAEERKREAQREEEEKLRALRKRLEFDSDE